MALIRVIKRIVVLFTPQSPFLVIFEGFEKPSIYKSTGRIYSCRNAKRYSAVSKLFLSHKAVCSLLILM